jgi:hypothetical protein
VIALLNYKKPFNQWRGFEVSGFCDEVAPFLLFGRKQNITDFDGFTINQAFPTVYGKIPVFRTILTFIRSSSLRAQYFSMNYLKN